MDAPVVEACTLAGVGQPVQLRVGCTLDTRFHQPVALEGVVAHVGSEPLQLTGPVFIGMEVSMGRYAVVQSGELSVLVTEHAAGTFDAATARASGLADERCRHCRGSIGDDVPSRFPWSGGRHLEP